MDQAQAEMDKLAQRQKNAEYMRQYRKRRAIAGGPLKAANDPVNTQIAEVPQSSPSGLPDAA